MVGIAFCIHAHVARVPELVYVTVSMALLVATLCSWRLDVLNVGLENILSGSSFFIDQVCR